MSKKRIMNRVIVLFLFVLLCILSLFIGVHSLSLKELIQISPVEWLVLSTTRLPRTISIILSGATLSLSGLLMQQITQNKFASPSTIGTTSSARLGLIFALLFFPRASLFNRALFAFGFAVLGTFLFTFILDKIQVKNPVIVPILGLLFGNTLSSFGTFIALQQGIVQDLSSWLQGNFSLVNSTNYQLIWLSMVSLVLIGLFAHSFSIMVLGKDVVTELGVSYQALRILGIVIIAIGTASVLLTVGQIPFVGLVIPNLVSLWKGDQFRENLFPVAIFGMIFLLLADILARVLIFPFEIPVSVIVGILGSLLFIYLLIRGERS